MGIMRSRRRKSNHRPPKFISALFLILFALLLLPKDSCAEGKDTFTVALTGKYPPFSFYSSTGELTGFDVDVTREIARRLGRKPVIITTEWDGILAGLLVKKYDAIIGSMAVTPTRAKKVSFSTPYYVSGAQLFIQDKDRGKINVIGDLYGRKVGVGLGETYEHHLRENYPGIEVVPYRSTVDIFQDMRNGRIQGFVSDRLVAPKLMSDSAHLHPIVVIIVLLAGAEFFGAIGLKTSSARITPAANRKGTASP